MRLRLLAFLIPFFLLFGCFDSDESEGEQQGTSGENLDTIIVLDTISPIKQGDTLLLSIELEQDEPYVFEARASMHSRELTVRVKDSSGILLCDNQSKKLSTPVFFGLTTPYAGSYVVEYFINVEKTEHDTLSLKVAKSEKLSPKFEGCWYLHEQIINTPDGNCYTFTMPSEEVSGDGVEFFSKFSIIGDTLFTSHNDSGKYKYIGFHFLDKDVQFSFSGDTLIFRKTMSLGVVVPEMVSKYLPSSMSLDELEDTQDNYNFLAPDSIQGAWYLKNEIGLRFYLWGDSLCFEEEVADSVSSALSVINIKEKEFDVYLRNSPTDTSFEFFTRFLGNGTSEWVHAGGYIKDTQLIIGGGSFAGDYDAILFVYERYDGPLPPTSWVE